MWGKPITTGICLGITNYGRICGIQIRQPGCNFQEGVLTSDRLNKFVLRVCHRMSSHPATPVQLDHCAWNLSLMVASR